MLTISARQMASLRGQAGDRFRLRMIEHLRRRFRERTAALPEERLGQVVLQARRKGECYGILLEDDLRRFLECFVTYGTQLDTNPATRWIGDVLRRGDLTGSQKMDVIDSVELQLLRELT